MNHSKLGTDEFRVTGGFIIVLIAAHNLGMKPLEAVIYISG